MTRQVLLSGLETARQSEDFQNYLQIRHRVLDMLDEMERQTTSPSAYWEEELAAFDYMLDASPLIVRKMREHCHHLTGIRAYEYRGHHGHQRDAFARKLRILRQQDADDLLVPEPRTLGGFGYTIDGALFNIDTLKYYECLLALNKAGILSAFRASTGERKNVLEIGAGWGGFAYQFKTLCPNVTYFIIDLPQTLMFSAIYLKTLFPSASILLYGDKPKETLLTDCQSHDFVFLPHFFLDRLDLSRLDLAINTVSFQEMTSEQVDRYVRKVYEMGCPTLYSLNRDRSPHNQQLTTVSSILAKYYELRPLNVLDMQYAAMPVSFKRGQFRKGLKSFVRRLFRGRKASSIFDYQHLIGTRPRVERSAGD